MTAYEFCLNNTCEEKILKIMTNIESSKAAEIEKLSVSFLKDGTNILRKLISAIGNLSISQGAKCLKSCENEYYF